MEKEQSSIELKSRFQELYSLPEWKDIDAIYRVQLLLVAEGYKPGTIIMGNHRSFLDILKRIGLDYSYDSDSRIFEPIFTVAPKAILEQYYREIILFPEGGNEDGYHYINGKFLGYPKCCTDEYCNPWKNIGERILKYGDNFISNFSFEAIEEGEYPDELNYCPPSFTPCSIHCQAARSLLQNWKKLAEHYDPEGGAELREFNLHAKQSDFSRFSKCTPSDKINKILLGDK